MQAEEVQQVVQLLSFSSTCSNQPPAKEVVSRIGSHHISKQTLMGSIVTSSSQAVGMDVMNDYISSVPDVRATFMRCLPAVSRDVYKYDSLIRWQSANLNGVNSQQLHDCLDRIIPLDQQLSDAPPGPPGPGPVPPGCLVWGGLDRGTPVAAILNPYLRLTDSIIIVHHQNHNNISLRGWTPQPGPGPGPAPVDPLSVPYWLRLPAELPAYMPTQQLQPIDRKSSPAIFEYVYGPTRWAGPAGRPAPADPGGGTSQLQQQPSTRVYRRSIRWKVRKMSACAFPLLPIGPTPGPGPGPGPAPGPPQGPDRQQRRQAASSASVTVSLVCVCALSLLESLLAHSLFESLLAHSRSE
jgi:hypothetical protein